ncbi:hypothetical protein ABZ806_19015 [Spirillospora sp. NPDC047418]
MDDVSRPLGLVKVVMASKSREGLIDVALIVTPDEVIECPDRRRPGGVIWQDLTPEKIEAIPALSARHRRP